MDKITKFILKHYFSIRLILGIVAIGLIGLLAHQVYSLIQIQNQPVMKRNFRVIKKPLAPAISRKEMSFEIYSGDTIDSIGKRLEEKDILKKDIFLSYLRQEKVTIHNQAYYKNKKENIFEGFFFPGAYSLPVPTSPEEVSSILIQSYINWVDTTYTDNAQSDITPEEIVTIASIIEKEAGLDEDRPMIAGVIYNRLNKKMKLQIDSTVLYAMGQHKSNLTIEDLKTPSPYNTYLVNGLPPGPICTPSYKSLQGALDPQRHSYYFYVVQTYGSPKHIFSTTYEEHLENVRKYRNSINNY